MLSTPRATDRLQPSQSTPRVPPVLFRGSSVADRYAAWNCGRLPQRRALEGSQNRPSEPIELRVLWVSTRQWHARSSGVLTRRIINIRETTSKDNGVVSIGEDSGSLLVELWLTNRFRED